MSLVEQIQGLLRRPIEVDVISGNGRKKVIVPKYSLTELPPGMCSRFVRLAAKDMFGVEYPIAHAWELRNKGCQTQSLGEWSLQEAYFGGDLREGDAIGLFNTRSKHNGKLDSLGNVRLYTHVGELVGISPRGEALIADEYKVKVRVSSERDLVNSGMKPIEILRPAA